MKAITLIVLGLLVSGCGTQARRVECDWQLKPINVPAKAAAPSSPSTEPRQ